MTPSIALPGASSTDFNLPRYVGERSTRPYIMPGSVISEGYWCLPVTLSRAAGADCGLPIVVQFAVGVTRVSADGGSANFFVSSSSLTRSANEIDSFDDGWWILPSAIETVSASTFHF